MTQQHAQRHWPILQLLLIAGALVILPYLFRPLLNNDAATTPESR